jgi:hypothetical protein
VKWRIEPPIRHCVADSSILLIGGSCRREMLAEQRDYAEDAIFCGSNSRLPTNGLPARRLLARDMGIAHWNAGQARAPPERA